MTTFDKAWFERHQRKLLWLLNVPVLRLWSRRALWVRAVAKKGAHLPIVKITPNTVHLHRGSGQVVAYIHSGNTFAEAVKRVGYPVWRLAHEWDLLANSLRKPEWNLGFDTLNQESDIDDFYILGGNSNYSTARSTSSSYNNNNRLEVGQLHDGATYYIMRTGLKFDTSVIAGGTVDQVNMRLVCTEDGSTTADFNVEIVPYDWSALDPVSDTNKEDFYDGALAATRDVIWRNTSGMSINTQYTSPNMDTAYINGAGNTYFAIRSEEDKNASNPGTSSGEKINLAPASHATASYRPTLVVEYTVAVGGAMPIFF